MISESKLTIFRRQFQNNQLNLPATAWQPHLTDCVRNQADNIFLNEYGCISIIIANFAIEYNIHIPR